MVGSSCEGVVVPIGLAGALELLLNKVFEADHVVFVGDFVHLGVEEELVGGSFDGWQSTRAVLANEVLAIVAALVVANMVWAEIPKRAPTPAVTVSSMGEVVGDGLALSGIGRSTDYFEFMLLVVGRACSLSLFGQERRIFSLVEILNEKLDYSRIIVWKINFALRGFLQHLSVVRSSSYEHSPCRRT